VRKRNQSIIGDQKVLLITTSEKFYSLRSEWQALNNKSLKGNIFTSWEWLYTWWEVYHSDSKRQLYIITCRDENNLLTGLAPFQIINNPKKYFPCSRQLIMLGTGETDGSFIFGEYMDLLISPGHEEMVTRLFSQYLYEHSDIWDGIKFHQILANSEVSRLFTQDEEYKGALIQTVQAHGFRTIIKLPETYQAYLMTLRKKMRNNITRIFSRLEREQSYNIEKIDDIDVLDDAISLLAELNRTRRSDMELSSSFEQINFENYHHRLARRLFLLNDPNNSFTLRIMYFAKKPVAVLYCFVDGDTIHAYQSGFEKENGQRYSLLTTMLTQEISYSISNRKLKYFNFMYADNESTYKRRYSGITEKVYDISFDHNNLKGRFYLFLHGSVKALVKKLMFRSLPEN